MVIEPKFDFKAINKRIAEYQKRIISAQILTLRFLGEECVKRAKLIPKSIGFEDQTGNLRSSIGYVVFVDGKAVDEMFEIILNGKDGLKKGKQLAYKVGKENNEGLVLVVVAGMEYALHLEAKYKRDVLTSTEHFAKQELPRMLNDLKLNIKNMDI